MATRRSVKILFAVPAILTLGLAVRPERSVESFNFVSDPELDRRIDAYVPIVRLAQPHTTRFGAMDAENAERLGRTWVAEVEAGNLKPLRPLIESDSVFEGATGQIMRAQRAIANTLMIRGEKRIQQGRMRSGAEDLVLAMRVYRSTQYSDFQSATLIGLQSRRAIAALGKAKAKMPPADRQWLAATLRPFRVDVRQLAELGLTMQSLHEESLVRKGKPLPNEPNVGRLLELRQASPENAVAAIESFRAQVAKDEESRKASALGTTLDRILGGELVTQRKLDEILADD